MMKFSDGVTVGQVKKTKEGYVIATCRVARTGVQLYRAGELGDAAAHLPADKVVRVYRAPEAVFSEDTIASLTRVPVTIDHPPEMVTADNWKEYAVGEVGDRIAQDGDWLVVNPMIKDAAGSASAMTTHREISLGYMARIIPARDGVGADFEQTEIKIDHLAFVPRGRAGSQARLGDAQTWGASPVTLEDKDMTVELKTVILGDKSVQVEAKDAETVAAILKDHKTAIDDKDKAIGELKAKLADAEAKVLDDDAIAKLVASRVEADTKRAACKAKFGDDAVKDASDAEIDGMFRVIGKASASSKVADAIKDQKIEDDAEARIQAAVRKHLKQENK